MPAAKRTPTCFIIPSHLASNGRLYTEVFLPAISEAGFQVDCNHSEPETCPMDGFIDSIVSADACFADLTNQSTDVWAAIGYALALRKPVCLVATEVYAGSPFVASLPGVIYYPLHPFPSDYQALKGHITNRLASIVQQASLAVSSQDEVQISLAGMARLVHEGPPSNAEQELATALSPLRSADTRSLKFYEHLALKLIAQHQAEQGLSLKMLAKEMNKYGVVQATSVAVSSLKRMHFIERRDDPQGDVSTSPDGLFVTPAGDEWLREHTLQLEGSLLALSQEPKSLDLIDTLMTS